MSRDEKHAAWITMQVKAMLSHYPAKWNEDVDVVDRALDTWVDLLLPFPKRAIDQAITSYVQSSAEKPVPNVIRERVRLFAEKGAESYGDQSQLTMDEKYLLAEKVLPKARAWINDHPPGHPLYEHGLTTLGFWGEAQ